MRVVIYLPFALSLAFAVLSRFVCHRTVPRQAAWSVIAAMVLLAGASIGALVLLAWPLPARLPLVAQLGGWRAGAVDQLVPVPMAVSVLAALVLVAVIGLVFDQARGLRAGLIQTSRMHSELAQTGGAAVAVLDDPRPSAHALPPTLAHRGRVVVSTGLLGALDDDERAAVLAHEHAHLDHSHRLFVAVAALAAATNPLLSSCRGDLAFALERWADEEAAHRTSRTVTARALAKSALARLSTLPDGIAPGLAMELGRLGVPQRVAALLEPEDHRRRAVLAWLVAGVALGGLVAMAWATRDTEHLFELLQQH